MKALLGAALIGLSGLLLVQWWDWPRALQRSLPLQPAHEGKDAERLKGAEQTIDLKELRNRESYSGVIERPLFVPDRRPPDPEPINQQEFPDDEVVPVDSLDLLAIIITPKVARAWIRENRETRHVEVRLEEEIAGWTVKAIRSNALVLERQGDKRTLKLRSFSVQPEARQPSPLHPASTPQRGTMPQRSEPNHPSRGNARNAAR